MCDCITSVNAQLAPHNTKIVVPMWALSGIYTPFIETAKLDTKQRGKAKALFASFCPFCGERYPSPSPDGKAQR